MAGRRFKTAEKAFLFADAHIKSRLWTNYPKIQGDSYEALKVVQEKADGQNVISCGDLFDSNRPSSMDLKVVSDFLKHVKRFYYVNGNHDDAIPDIVSSLGANTVHLNDTPIFIGEVPFFGIDYCNTKEELVSKLAHIGDIIREYSSTPVLIMHQALDVFFMHYTITRKEIEELLQHSCNIFVGDIHVPKKFIGYHNDFSGLTECCVSPGPLVPQDIGQAKNHNQFFLELTCNERRLDRIDDVHIKVRDYFFLEDPKGLDNTVKEALQSDKKLPPVIFIKTDTEFKVPKEYANRDDIIIVTDTTPKELQKEACTSSSVSLLDAVLEEIQETEPELAKLMSPLVTKLMQSEQPDELLLSLIKKWNIILA